MYELHFSRFGTHLKRYTIKLMSFVAKHKVFEPKAVKVYGRAFMYCEDTQPPQVAFVCKITDS
jgi:hypothetical protein